MNAHGFRISLEFSTPSRTDDFVKRTFKLSDILQLLKQSTAQRLRQTKDRDIDVYFKKIHLINIKHLAIFKVVHSGSSRTQPCY